MNDLATRGAALDVVVRPEKVEALAKAVCDAVHSVSRAYADFTDAERECLTEWATHAAGKLGSTGAKLVTGFIDGQQAMVAVLQFLQKQQSTNINRFMSHIVKEFFNG